MTVARRYAYGIYGIRDIYARGRHNAQCSCFPVRVCPGAAVPKLVCRMGSSFVSTASVVVVVVAADAAASADGVTSLS